MNTILSPYELDYGVEVDVYDENTMRSELTMSREEGEEQDTIHIYHYGIQVARMSCEAAVDLGYEAII